MASCFCNAGSVDLCTYCEDTFGRGWDSGVVQERERIIALLDSLKCDCDGECGMVEAPFTVLEKLIKGENE